MGAAFGPGAWVRPKLCSTTSAAVCARAGVWLTAANMKTPRIERRLGLVFVMVGKRTSNSRQCHQYTRCAKSGSWRTRARSKTQAKLAGAAASGDESPRGLKPAPQPSAGFQSLFVGRGPILTDHKAIQRGRQGVEYLAILVASSDRRLAAMLSFNTVLARY